MTHQATAGATLVASLTAVQIELLLAQLGVDPSPQILAANGAAIATRLEAHELDAAPFGHLYLVTRTDGSPLVWCTDYRAALAMVAAEHLHAAVCDAGRDIGTPGN